VWNIMNRKIIAAIAALLVAALTAIPGAPATELHHIVLLAATAPIAAVVRPELYTRAEACRVLSISMSTLYVLMAKGELKAIKILGATRITAESVGKLLAAAPQAEMSNYYVTPRTHRRRRARERERGVPGA
jgi:excisionase family DNA binding protein